MTRIKYDDKGAPYLARDKDDEPPKSQRTHVLLGIERFPLWHDDGRPTSPPEALDMLLSDGPISVSQFDHLASQFDNPEVIYGAAEQLGVIRKKREDGVIEVVLPAPEPEKKSTNLNLADTGREESTRMGIKESPDYAAAALVPLREAQELLGAPIIGSGLTIIREGRNRYVNKRELNDHLARVGRGGKGAGAKIADALEDATTRRAQTNARGQGNDAHRRRYGQAKLTGRD